MLDDLPPWMEAISSTLEELRNRNQVTFGCVGSRETNVDVCEWMRAVCRLLLRLMCKGYSGGAEGPDDALCKAVADILESEGNTARGYELAAIFIGWYKFNGWIPGDLDGAILDGSKQAKHHDATKLARAAHPNFDGMKPGGQTLHTRNCYQILTETLNNPIGFLMFSATRYDSTGIMPLGGTSTAWKIATALEVPTFDCGKSSDRQALLEYISELFADSEEAIALIAETELPEVTTDFTISEVPTFNPPEVECIDFDEI